jgi:DNA mismatch repair protein MutL
LIEELINQFQYHSSDNKLNKNEKMIQFIAKKASSRYEVKLLPQEMISLIDKLFACSNPNYSPSGKRICITWDINELASLFK